MYEPTGTVTELVKTCTPIAALFAVCVGWTIVNHQNNARESRKEARLLIDRTLKYLGDAVDLATQYLSGLPDERPKDVNGWKVVLALGQISSNLNNLHRAGIDVSSCIAPYNAVKNCVTGGDFMTKNWRPWPVEDKRWVELLGMTKILSEVLDRVFIDTYAAKIRQRRKR